MVEPYSIGTVLLIITLGLIGLFFFVLVPALFKLLVTIALILLGIVLVFIVMVLIALNWFRNWLRS